jgi:hypothetical protein
VTSGRRNKQIQVYDPAIAEKQAVVQENAGQADKNVGSKHAGRARSTLGRWWPE